MKYATLLPSPFSPQSQKKNHRFGTKFSSTKLRFVSSTYSGQIPPVSQKPFLMESLNPRFQGNLSRIVSRTFDQEKRVSMRLFWRNILHFKNKFDFVSLSSLEDCPQGGSGTCFQNIAKLKNRHQIFEFPLLKSQWCFDILLMEEILRHLGCTTPRK